MSGIVVLPSWLLYQEIHLSFSFSTYGCTDIVQMEVFIACIERVHFSDNVTQNICRDKRNLYIRFWKSLVSPISKLNWAVFFFFFIMFFNFIFILKFLEITLLMKTILALHMIPWGYTRMSRLRVYLFRGKDCI